MNTELSLLYGTGARLASRQTGAMPDWRRARLAPHYWRRASLDYMVSSIAVLDQFWRITSGHGNSASPVATVCTGRALGLYWHGASLAPLLTIHRSCDNRPV